MTKKMSDEESALFRMITEANDGKSTVESLKPNPGDCVVLATPDAKDMNDKIGVINIALRVVGPADSPHLGKTLRTALWLNTPDAISRTANTLSLALEGKWLSESPTIGKLIEWINDFMATPQFVVERKLKQSAESGRWFANDKFFLPNRWAELQAKDEPEPTPEELAKALAS